MDLDALEELCASIGRAWAPVVDAALKAAAVVTAAYQPAIDSWLAEVGRVFTVPNPNAPLR